MRAVLKRIAVNGLLTAVVLGVIGYGFAELAGLWLATRPTDRAGAVAAPLQPAGDSVVDSLKTRVPVTLALWGFLFVAVGEMVMYLIRGNRPNAAEQAAMHKPDPAEVLLEEMLSRIESVKEKPADPTPPSPPVGESSPAPVPSDRGP